MHSQQSQGTGIDVHENEAQSPREKSWRGGQFAVFTKNLDFSRLRNEIRMRSLVPRERKNVVEELSTHKFDEHIENRCVLFNPSTWLYTSNSIGILSPTTCKPREWTSARSRLLIGSLRNRTAERLSKAEWQKNVSRDCIPNLTRHFFSEDALKNFIFVLWTVSKHSNFAFWWILNLNNFSWILHSCSQSGENFNFSCRARLEFPRFCMF